MSSITPVWIRSGDFHIEKARLDVTVITRSRESIDGFLFIQASSRHLSGFEDAPDVLNSSDPFFPLGIADGRVLLFAKSHIREVHVVSAETDPTSWEIGTRAEVAVVLDDGRELEGTILIELDVARQRVLDFLNRTPDRFLITHTEAGVVLVNRDYISHVVQVS